MSNLIMTLPIRAMSYNNFMTSTKSGRRFVTGRGKQYVEELNFLLSKYKEQLFYFGLNVEWPTMFRMEIRYYYLNYLTKKDVLSKTCNDVDNPNKIVIDKVFGFMGVDDYLLGELHCSKHKAINEDMIFITLNKYTDTQLKIF
jgi:hypothetical protein